MLEQPDYWRKCSSCKKPISYGAQYWACNVSTCNKKSNPMVFCKVPCWSAHVPIMNHRESWAEEKIAPTRDSIRTSSKSPASSSSKSGKEILVVASKVKSYIKEQSGMSTSVSALEALSDIVRRLSDAAIENAKSAQRQTVMRRDIKFKPKARAGIVRRRPNPDK